MSVKKAKTQISFEPIWLDRWNQNIEGALRGLAFVQSEKGWVQLEVALLESAPSDEFEELVEALLLKSSLFRAQGKPKESSQIINKVYRHFQKKSLKNTFRLAFEVAMDFWIAEDYTQALEFFLLAEQKATTEVQKLFCSSNMLWCLEALDLDRENVERNLEQNLRNLLDEAPLASVRNIHDQYQAYLLRKRFYSGQLSFLDIEIFLQYTGQMTQSVFFSFLINRLPYFSGQSETGMRDNVELLGEEYLWQGSYRMRTLEGVLVPSDRYLFRCGDAIDRLYLWTWMLMAENPKMNLEKIEVTLSSLQTEIEIGRLATENRLLLRNAIRWLLILAPRAAAGFRSMIERKFEVSSRYKILEDEFSFSEQLAEQKRFLDFRGLGFHFGRIGRELYEAQANMKVPEKILLPRLARVLIENRGFERSSDQSIRLIVDMSTHELRNVQTGEVLRSQSLCELFQKLQQTPRFGIAELGDGCVQDRRKLYNLVARARALLPLAGIGTLGESVICASPEELKVYIVKADLVSRHLDAGVRVGGGRAGAREKLVSIEAAKVHFKEGFTRSELEKSFKVSKAKACRVLADWQEDNLIEKAGTGKSPFYRWRTP